MFIAGSEFVQQSYSDLGTLIGAVIVSIAFQIISALVTALKRGSAERALKKVHERVIAIDKKVTTVSQEQIETKHELNGRVTELLEIAKAGAYAAGKLDGIEEEKLRTASGEIAK